MIANVSAAISPRPIDAEARPLIAHVVYRFDTGGLENGLVNLLNRMPEDRYRHAVVSMTTITSFKERVLRNDVTFVALNKAPGQGIKLLPRLTRLFRQLRPSIVHTRNLAALEATLPAWLARVPVRVHGEHGWDIVDLHGTRRAYRLVRRLYSPYVTQYVAVSEELEHYLTALIAIDASRVVRIINGVDIERFRPADAAITADWPFNGAADWVIGTVGRLHPVKNQTLLARAFVRLLERAPELRASARLAIVGSGPLRSEIADILRTGHATELAWLPGERMDIPEILRRFDVFVLPSLAEGVSNTILEAMATALPVVATDVGGNRELIQPGQSGLLVPVNDVDALADALLQYARQRQKAREAGRAGRARAEEMYSLDVMIGKYVALYDRLLALSSGSSGRYDGSIGRRATIEAE
jgi:sugar transferase (PEP-CTERM/EpsH1 system associated)